MKEVLKMRKNDRKNEIEELANRNCEREIAQRVRIENLIKISIYGSRL